MVPIIVRSWFLPESKTMQATTGSPVGLAAATASAASAGSDMVSTHDAVGPGVGHGLGLLGEAPPAAPPALTSPIISITPLGPIEAKTLARPPAARREISTPARLISATLVGQPVPREHEAVGAEGVGEDHWLPAST